MDLNFGKASRAGEPCDKDSNPCITAGEVCIENKCIAVQSQKRTRAGISNHGKPDLT